MFVLGLLLGALAAGAAVFCVLTVLAARSYLRQPLPALSAPEPVSILKPLHGLDEGLEENLRSFFRQQYPDFEILCAVREANDPALQVVEKLRGEYPAVPCRVFVTGEPQYANAKVFSLAMMMREARNDLLVMSDSDIRVTNAMLACTAAEFQDRSIGIATCPYRATPGASFWSRLEAIGMNTEFTGGVLVARLVEGVKFAVGPTIVARRRVLESIGGFDRLKDYLAEDFVMGKFAAEAGHGVILSRYIVEHRIGSQPFAANMKHRLRWCRSTRRSRPAGYAGQLFTYPTAIAMLLVAAQPAWWPAAALLLVLRIAAAWAVSGCVLHDTLTARAWYLVPLQDLLSFAFWIAGFFGNTIVWRNRRYRVFSDGRFAPV